MVIVGRAKYPRARVYFVRPTIAIAKIRDYSQSNSEGKRKTVRVSGVSSYRGRVNIQFGMLIIDGLLIFQHFSIITVQIKLISSETVTSLCILMIIQYCECNSVTLTREMTVKYIRDLFVALIKIKLL